MWMVTKKKSTKNVLIDLYHFFFFINTNYKLSYFKFFNNNFNKLIKYLYIFKKLNINDFYTFPVFSLTSKLSLKYRSRVINFKIDNKIKRFDFNPFFKDVLFDTNQKFQTKLFNLFFLLNYSLNSSQFKINAEFKLFSAFDKKNGVAILQVKPFLLRWTDAHNLFCSIFFYNLGTALFGTTLFKNETLALNWHLNEFDINLWRYYFPFFVFKTNSYNKKIKFFLNRLEEYNVNFYIISDCTYHFKNIHFLNKHKFYSIGLVNANMSPWIVSYPIISFFDSYITQLFFFKILIFAERQIMSHRFNLLKNIWIKNLHLKTNCLILN